MPRPPLPHLCTLALFALLILNSRAQVPVSAASAPAHLLDRAWEASWIAPPGPVARVYGVHHFRKNLELEESPSRFVVHVSADNEYRLFVNGTAAHSGPARGDLTHWRFDSLDIAPLLHAGHNVIAAQVWNYAEHAPVAQVSNQTAFILQGDGELESAVNTDTTWRTFTNRAYVPIGDFGARLWTYIVVGPGDDVDGALYPWGWEQLHYDESTWEPAKTLRKGTPRGHSTDGMWSLVPRQIPLMSSDPIRLQAVRRTEGLDLTDTFLAGENPVVVPPHSTVSVLLDQKEYTTAYPELKVSGGAGSSITLTYAEALYEGPIAPSSKTKGHRDEIEGKHLRGFFDIFRPDGGPHRLFRPLRWRSWRYVQLDITTADEPLQLDDLRGDFSAYPFSEHGRFSSDDPSLERIWDIAWRTLRTGTHDIYTDSPYYEQLSYVGDTRIEALVSVLVSGDDRLMRKSIEAFDESRTALGLTSSRWPDSRFQVIPPYSLVWISMVHDYWMLRDDPEFVQSRLAGVREVLRYYAEHSDPKTGSYTGRKWWNYIDWKPEWGRDPAVGLGGVPPRDAQGTSAILDLQHVYTLRQAADLLAAFGFEAEAETYRQRARRIRAFIVDSCWDPARGLLADTPDLKSYSQHANTYLILTADEPDAAGMHQLAKRMQDAPDLAQATLYFTFYSHAAYAAAGLGDDYVNWLDPWRQVLAQGLTTVPETPGPGSRSDSHAWGSHPILGLLETVLGITPAEPGFKSVRIAPHLGRLQQATGAVPHPRGEIAVRLEIQPDGKLAAHVSLPEGLTGVFEWKGSTTRLHSGSQSLIL